MIKILSERWMKNSNKLKEYITTHSKEMNNCNYEDLVKLCFDIIYNTGKDSEDYVYGLEADTTGITKIDDGDYQGTLMFLIPFDTYQPSSSDYLLTFVEYGSCSCCDTLQSIQAYGFSNEEALNPGQVKGFMSLCKDIINNTIRPYNYGWRNNPDFDPVDDVI